jgi:conjugative transfer signal peptidase TraF
VNALKVANPPTAIAIAIVLSLGALAISCAYTATYRLIYNPSGSAPRGWYWEARAHVLKVNDFVIAWLPESARTLAAARQYLPRGTPILKRVGAVNGQWVCYRDGAIWIDWRRSAFDRVVDGMGRPLPLWKDCRKLRRGEYFLLSFTNDASFDSRYFGPIAESEAIGEAIPLWVW